MTIFTNKGAVPVNQTIVRKQKARTWLPK